MKLDADEFTRSFRQHKTLWPEEVGGAIRSAPAVHIGDW